MGKTDWKAVLKAFIEILKSIGRGDILIRMRVDKLFPYILYTFILGIVSIWLSFKAEKTMRKVEVNKATIESLEYANVNKTCDIIRLSRLSTVEEMLKERDSKVAIPEKPAYIITKRRKTI